MLAFWYPFGFIPIPPPKKITFLQTQKKESYFFNFRITAFDQKSPSTQLRIQETHIIYLIYRD